MKKVIVFYPYDTGERAFSGGVAKVAVSNIMAVHMHGEDPYLMLPKGNTGLIGYVKQNCPYCHIEAMDVKMIALYSNTKNPFTRIKCIIRDLIKFLSGRNAVRKRVEEINPDVIHFHETITFPFFGCGKQAKKVLHLHGYPFLSRHLYMKFICNATEKHIDEIISPTKSIKDAMQPLLSKEIKIVMTPYLDLSDSNREPKCCEPLEKIKSSGKLIFSFIGRIVNIKRLECCLQAMALLSRDELAKMKYVVIGDCNTPGDKAYKQELIKIIEDNCLQDYVDFVGYISPVEAALPYIDYGVMLTVSEAMPMVGIEYLRYNIPTIGFDAPGINDYVVTGSTGFLVENGSVEKLAETFKEILKGDNIPNFKTTIPPVFKAYSLESFADALKPIYY